MGDNTPEKPLFGLKSEIEHFVDPEVGPGVSPFRCFRDSAKSNGHSHQWLRAI